jgi:outer membrane immunogenic protein
MRRVTCSTICVLALTATGALAADIPRAPPARAPVVVPAINWTGGYIGINGGYAWGWSSWDGFGSGNFNTNGGLVGLTLGYNWQGIGSPWVFGLEGDIDWSNIKGSFTNAACPVGCETKNTWLGTVRGRLGYAVDRVMPYFTGGLAVGDVRATPTGFGGMTTTRAGWTVGAGIEAAIAPRWTGKIEYLYVDLGNPGCSIVDCGFATNVPLRANVVRAGVNYRF